MDPLLTEVFAFLRDLPMQWAVCGGFALDLFLQRTTRRHSDIDLCVFEKDRNAILQYMRKDWRVYEFRGQGKMRPLDAASVSETGRNLMCVKGACPLVRFYPCEEAGLLVHEFFPTGIRELNYMELLFNQTDGVDFVFDAAKDIRRALSEALLHHGDIPYLAPEIVLLYKASQADKADYAHDFAQTFPHLSDEQKAWFLQKLDILYPNGHPWKS